MVVLVHIYDDVSRSLLEAFVETYNITTIAKEPTDHFGPNGKETCYRVGIVGGEWMYVAAADIDKLKKTE